MAKMNYVRVKLLKYSIFRTFQGKKRGSQVTATHPSYAPLHLLCIVHCWLLPYVVACIAELWTLWMESSLRELSQYPTWFDLFFKIKGSGCRVYWIKPFQDECLCVKYKYKYINIYFLKWFLMAMLFTLWVKCLYTRLNVFTDGSFLPPSSRWPHRLLPIVCFCICFPQRRTQGGGGRVGLYQLLEI